MVLRWRASARAPLKNCHTFMARWRASTKIMQQSEQQASNKFTGKGDIFWLWPRQIDTGLPVLSYGDLLSVFVNLGRNNILWVPFHKRLFLCRPLYPFVDPETSSVKLGQVTQISTCGFRSSTESEKVVFGYLVYLEKRVLADSRDVG